MAAVCRRGGVSGPIKSGRFAAAYRLTSRCEVTPPLAEQLEEKQASNTCIRGSRQRRRVCVTVGSELSLGRYATPTRRLRRVQRSLVCKITQKLQSRDHTA